MKQKIIEYFNKGAYTYDSAAEVQMHVAERLAARLPAGQHQAILEIGCGTGILSEHLVKQFPHSSLVLTDIAPQMVQVCQERFKQHPRVTTRCLDGEALAIPAKFDLIVSSMTLHWFQNINASFEKMIALLAPGGKLVFSMLGDNSLQEWKDLCMQVQFPIPTPKFPQKNKITERFSQLMIETEYFPQLYSSAYAFLDSLKRLGARAAHEKHIPASAGDLRRVLRQYQQEMTITYEVFYGCYQHV